MNFLDPRLPMAFWAKAIPEPMSGCWLWLGAHSRGYGRITRRGRKLPTHRLAFEVANGPIPTGLQIDHLCRTSLCCNPAHLEAVTQAENGRRGLNGVLKTHCPAGHPYDAGNTRIWPPGTRRRYCRACQHEYQRRIRERRAK